MNTISLPCRLCDGEGSSFRSVHVGGEVRRTWPICDECLAELRSASWVSVEEDDDEVRLSVAPADLLDAIGEDSDDVVG